MRSLNSHAASTSCSDWRPTVSHKVLTQTVRHLVTQGLVLRTVGNGASPCVEYALSEQGETVRPILAAMIDWGHARLDTDAPQQDPHPS